MKKGFKRPPFSKEWRKNIGLASIGRVPVNKGTHQQTNDALKIWRENGGQPWNKGLKGYHTQPCSEEKKLKIGIANAIANKGKVHAGTYKKGRISPKGKDHPMWKGGITPINKLIRHSVEFQIWHKEVFTKDDYTCRKCKVKGGRLHAHHIQNFAQYPELRFVVSNGITFCRDCHILFHKIYGRRNNNQQQITEFLSNVN
jgi:hypothetical protein